MLLCDNDHETWYFTGFRQLYIAHPRPCKKRPVSRVKVFIYPHKSTGGSFSPSVKGIVHKKPGALISTQKVYSKACPGMYRNQLLRNQTGAPTHVLDAVLLFALPLLLTFVQFVVLSARGLSSHQLLRLPEPR